jgi:post-segregation antitoxin (ccd killing protein)
MKLKKENYTIRVNPELRKQAKDAGINIPDLLEQVLVDVLQAKTCPTCGQTIDKTGK